MVQQQVDTEWSVVSSKSKQQKSKPKSDTVSRQIHTVRKTDEKSPVFLNMKKLDSCLVKICKLPKY